MAVGSGEFQCQELIAGRDGPVELTELDCDFKRVSGRRREERPEADPPGQGHALPSEIECPTRVEADVGARHVQEGRAATEFRP